MEIHLSITRGHTVALFKIITLGVLLGFSIQFLFAWTAPTNTPPNDNVAGPLTTGNGAQTKASGNISLAGGGSLYAGGLVAAPQMCIGADCRAVWPTSGTTYTAGTGLTLTGTTLSVDNTSTQSRVSGTCAVGSSIRTIAADGTVACETDDTTGGYIIGNGLTLTGSTLSINTAQAQSRVSGTCAVGSSIRSIAANGTVACEVDDASAGGDNLGSHTATQNLNMLNQRIYGLAAGGANSISWANAANTGNGIFSDGPNGNMAVRMSGSFYIQNQTGTGYVPLIAGTSIFAGAMSLSNNRINNLGSPVNVTDAATKGYVDGLVGSGRAAAWLWWEGGLKASNGISSAVDSGNQVVVNFSVPRADANYAVICNGSLSGSNSPSASELSIYAYSRTVNGFLVEGAIAPGSDNIISMDCVVYD